MFKKLVQRIISTIKPKEPIKPDVESNNVSGLFSFTTSNTNLGYMHGMVKSNDGYFFSDAQQYMMFKNWSNHKDYTDASISRTFPEVEWVYPYSVVKTFDGKKVLTHYMMLGNLTGICYKLKQANRSEQSENIGNGYMVIWERPIN